MYHRVEKKKKRVQSTITCLGRSGAGEYTGQVSESGVRMVICQRLPAPN